MSALINQTRSRVPRIAEAAVERARLTVVPRRTRRAARVPFVTLVSLVLVSGVVGLLLFNTSMQQASFQATKMEDRAAALAAQQESLEMELATLRDPQRLAERAQRMHMVPPASPAFIRLSDGKVLGDPQPATAGDGLRITPLPTRKPANLRPATVIAEVPAGHAGETGPSADGAAKPGKSRSAGDTADGDRGEEAGSER